MRRSQGRQGLRPGRGRVMSRGTGTRQWLLLPWPVLREPGSSVLKAEAVVCGSGVVVSLTLGKSRNLLLSPLDW